MRRKCILRVIEYISTPAVASVHLVNDVPATGLLAPRTGCKTETYRDIPLSEMQATSQNCSPEDPLSELKPPLE